MNIPATIGKYRIQRELGRGAMAVVYEALDPVIKRKVAIKVLSRDVLEPDRADEFVARFRREAQAAGRLAHPNVVAVYDCGSDEGREFIAMEYLEGRELRQLMAQKKVFPLAEAVQIMGQLLAALDYSHAQGVVHRDIKPANVIVGADGKVKVADFGIARIDASTLTRGGTVLGSPNYMSPEQFLGQTVDRRSDLFSAGIILYEMLTGYKPFPGGSLSQVMQQVVQGIQAPPSQVNRQLPAAVDAVIERALQKRPEERFQSAGEFAKALREAARQALAAPPPAPAPAPELPAAPAPAPPRSVPWLLWAGLAALAAAGLWYVLR